MKNTRARNGGNASDPFFRTARKVISNTLLESIHPFVRDLLHRGMTVVLLYGIAGTLLGVGFVLLLIGGFHALRMIPLPDAAADAIVGLLALGGGLTAVGIAGSKRKP